MMVLQSQGLGFGYNLDSLLAVKLKNIETRISWVFFSTKFRVKLLVVNTGSPVKSEI
jgi:hypothetical protein